MFPGPCFCDLASQDWCPVQVPVTLNQASLHGGVPTSSPGLREPGPSGRMDLGQAPKSCMESTVEGPTPKIRRQQQQVATTGSI